MAEEAKTQPAPTSEGKTLKKFIPIVAIIVAAAAAGLATFHFVVGPMLVEPTPSTEPETEETVEEETIPLTAQTVTFDKNVATVIMPAGSDVPASILMFQVSFECANEQTKALVEAHKARFVHMINELHEFRTREELNDRLVKQSIEEVAKQKANDILKQLQQSAPKPEEPLRITAVFHDQFVIQDQM